MSDYASSRLDAMRQAIRKIQLALNDLYNEIEEVRGTLAAETAQAEEDAKGAKAEEIERKRLADEENERKLEEYMAARRRP